MNDLKSLSEVAFILDTFFDTSEKWAQRAAARDRWGDSVYAVSPRAVKWCALGALRKLGFTPFCTAPMVEDDLVRLNDESKDFTTFKDHLKRLMKGKR